MAAELKALVYGFDRAYVMQTVLEEILERRIPIYAFVDSRTVFNVVAKHSKSLEHRIQIDVYGIRQSYRCGKCVL